MSGNGCGCHEYWFGTLSEDACGCLCHQEGPLIDCPLCGGSGYLDTDSEGDRPLVKCDMCGGTGYGILGPSQGEPESWQEWA